MDESEKSIARDIAAISRIGAIPSLLRVICRHTGMGFAAVARVSDSTWTACAVQDDIQFGLLPGGQLDIATTLCRESRATRLPVVIDQASLDPVYRDHHTPRIYGIESYVSVPIVLRNGEYFGNLCAIDPRPAKVSDAQTLAMFQLFAEVIALQLESELHSHEIESALLDARATAELREQFIAVLGHDLRNPLAAIHATAEVLTRRTAEPGLLAMGRRIQASAKRMSGLIEDVMDFARGRLGSGLDVRIAPEDQLGTGLVDVVAELCEANSDRVVLDHIAIDRRVHCDRARVQQLLSNLLGNALTYGAPELPVEVEARIDGDDLLIAVLNRGEPIAAANIGRVFEPYWRPANSRPGGGLGLGLHICAQIVKAHGGTLEVSSSLESGTRFVARFPAGPAGPAITTVPGRLG